MVTLMILFFVVVYIVLAILFVKLIKKFTKRKLYKWLAVAFVILLPTWDVILGTIVYFTACRFIPKAAIYETAETDGIYYEGGPNNYIFDIENKGPQVGSAGIDLEKGYKYVESLVKEKHVLRNIEKISTTIYRCVPFPNESMARSRYQANMCISSDNVTSGYLVKIERIKTGISEIRFMKIKNRSTGKLMAEYNEVVIWSVFPFFNWMKWKWWSSKGISCPAKSRFYDFQYDVLKLKK